MALKKNLTSPHGIQLTDAYIRIVQFSGDKNTVSLVVAVYISEQARGSDKEPLYMKRLERLDIKNGATMAAMYAHLKTQEDFNGAMDV